MKITFENHRITILKKDFATHVLNKYGSKNIKILGEQGESIMYKITDRRVFDIAAKKHIK